VRAFFELDYHLVGIDQRSVGLEQQDGWHCLLQKDNREMKRVVQYKKHMVKRVVQYNKHVVTWRICQQYIIHLSPFILSFILHNK
jgi:hypothetical protein